METNLIISTSDLTNFEDCPEKYNKAKNLKLWLKPKYRQTYFVLGNFGHELLQSLLNNKKIINEEFLIIREKYKKILLEINTQKQLEKQENGKENKLTVEEQTEVDLIKIEVLVERFAEIYDFNELNIFEKIETEYSFGKDENNVSFDLFSEILQNDIHLNFKGFIDVLAMKDVIALIADWKFTTEDKGYDSINIKYQPIFYMQTISKKFPNIEEFIFEYRIFEKFAGATTLGKKDDMNLVTFKNRLKNDLLNKDFYKVKQFKLTKKELFDDYYQNKINDVIERIAIGNLKEYFPKNELACNKFSECEYYGICKNKDIINEENSVKFLDENIEKLIKK